MSSFHTLFLVICILSFTNGSPSMMHLGGGDELYSESVNFMAPRMEGSKVPHSKDIESDIKEKTTAEFEAPFDYSKFESYLNDVNEAAADPSSPEHNRIKRHAKRRRLNKKRNRSTSTTAGPDDTENKNGTTTEVPIARNGDDSRRSSKKKTKKTRLTDDFSVYNSPLRDFESNFVEMPKDLYQAHLRPGVIFRIHMSEAIIKMQYRNYGEDKDESVIEADVEYLRLTRKVINDEITKFEDLKWLTQWFNNRSQLITEHVCNTRYYVAGTPPTMFTHNEEYMKRLCLFDNVYIDHIPYVIGEDSSLMAAVAPPVLHCDAATCTSVPFIDSMMFDERLSRTNVRTMTRCQASCRAHCKNNPDCLKRCSDRCLRPE